MRVLVTGGGGFIGGHLVRHLSAAGHDVIAHYHLQPPQLGDCTVREVFQASLEELDALPRGVEAVVHTAARSADAGYSDHDIITSNVIGMDRLLRCSENASTAKFVFLSSVSVFGDVKAAVVDESVPQNFPNVYGTSKYLAECMLSSISAKLPSVSLRLPGVLGRGAARHWLARTTHALAHHLPVKIFSPTAPFNNAVHVADLGRFVTRLIEADLKGATVLSLGASGSLTVMDVVERLRARLQSRSNIQVGESSRAPFTISSERARRLFDYQAMDVAEMLDLYAGEVVSDLAAASAPSNAAVGR